jgi:hypothetical protein
VIALSFSGARRADAWGDSGHRIVAAIAWAQMTPEARRRVTELLMNAPLDSDIRTFRPESGTDEERDRQLFIAVATWPDYVRPKQHPTDRQEAQTAKYHKGTWHYINFFWDNGGPNGAPRDHPTLRPPKINALARLKKLSQDPGNETDGLDPAVKIAWILHLTGDLHQPLHTSARVTDAPMESGGDKGGNEFKINGGRSLHSYWDGAPDRSMPRNQGESDEAYIDRCVTAITDAFPFSSASIQANLKPGDVEGWTKEGLESSKKKVYAGVVRKEKPTTSYANKTFRVCKPALARAGYRLALMLNEKFQ